MRYAIPLVLLFAGCNVPATMNHADIIAALAVRYAAVICNQGKQPAPAPNVPSAGCESGCGCNGTGREKSGDGLAIVNCRCDDDCECKKAKAEPVVENEPPLVPVTSDSAACKNGQCQQPRQVTRWRIFRR
jgi:hypothetical protein